MCVLARWHWIHGSCFLQCFMPTATAALQMRVNIAGGAVHPGSSLVAWPECQTGPSRVTPAQRTRCVTFFVPPPSLLLHLLTPSHPLLSADVSVCLSDWIPTDPTRVNSGIHFFIYFYSRTVVAADARNEETIGAVVFVLRLFSS